MFILCPFLCLNIVEKIYFNVKIKLTCGGRNERRSKT